MKNALTQIGLVALLAYLLVGQTNPVAAQTNAATPPTNVIHHAKTPEELREDDREMLDKSVYDFIAQQKTRQPTKEEAEWLARVQRNFVPLKPWPEAFHKKETLQHCAAVLRAAIDPHAIELACAQLTNQPETVVALQNLATLAVSNLNVVADLIISPELVTRGYCAELSKPKYRYFFTFSATNNHPSVVRSFDKSQSDTNLQIMDGEFYANGRLHFFGVNSQTSKGRIRGSGLSFTEDGKLEDYWFAPKESKPLQ